MIITLLAPQKILAAASYTAAIPVVDRLVKVHLSDVQQFYSEDIHTSHGSFTVTNQETTSVSNIYFSVQLAKLLPNNAYEDITSQILPTFYNLKPGEEQRIPFSLPIPQGLNSGQYNIRVVAANQTGIPLSITTTPEFSINTPHEQFLIANWQNARLLVDGKEYLPLDAVATNPDNQIRATLTLVNPHNQPITVTPHIALYARTNGPDSRPLLSFNQSAITIAANTNQTITVDLPQQTKPESYLSFVSFLDSQGNLTSDTNSFRWVVSGETGKIVSVNAEAMQHLARSSVTTYVKMVGPPDGTALVDSSVSVKIFDKKGALLLEQNQPITTLGSGVKTVTVPVTFHSTLLPTDQVKVEATLFNVKGTSLDQSVNYIPLVEDLSLVIIQRLILLAVFLLVGLLGYWLHSQKLSLKTIKKMLVKMFVLLALISSLGLVWGTTNTKVLANGGSCVMAANPIGSCQASWDSGSGPSITATDDSLSVTVGPGSSAPVSLVTSITASNGSPRLTPSLTSCQAGGCASVGSSNNGSPFQQNGPQLSYGENWTIGYVKDGTDSFSATITAIGGDNCWDCNWSASLTVAITCASNSPSPSDSASPSIPPSPSVSPSSSSSPVATPSSPTCSTAPAIPCNCPSAAPPTDGSSAPPTTPCSCPSATPNCTTPSDTPTPGVSPSASPSPSNIPTPTPTDTPTPTPSPTPSSASCPAGPPGGGSNTPTPGTPIPPGITPPPGVTPTPTVPPGVTPTPSLPPNTTPTPTPGNTPTPTPVNSPTPLATPSSTPSDTPTPSSSPTPSSTATAPPPTGTPTPSTAPTLPPPPPTDTPTPPTCDGLANACAAGNAADCALWSSMSCQPTPTAPPPTGTPTPSTTPTLPPPTDTPTVPPTTPPPTIPPTTPPVCTGTPEQCCQQANQQCTIYADMVYCSYFAANQCVTTPTPPTPPPTTPGVTCSSAYNACHISGVQAQCAWYDQYCSVATTPPATTPPGTTPPATTPPINIQQGVNDNYGEGSRSF